MKNFKEIAEACLQGNLSGIFVLADGIRIHSSLLEYNKSKVYPYKLNNWLYTIYGKYVDSGTFSLCDIIDFIPNKPGINMEKRNVTLTLEKAKEWYQKGGELREVALQAFNENELKDNKPRSWKEYCFQRSESKEKGFYINEDSGIETVTWPDVWCNGFNHWRNVLPTKELAEAFLAMMQLMSLRQAWIGDWKPDWKEGNTEKWGIIFEGDTLKVVFFRYCVMPLFFPTKEMAEEFRDCFEDLLISARELS